MSPRRSSAPDAEIFPFLKWAGGKGRLLPELERRFPKSFSVYHEPFLGAGAVFFRLVQGLKPARCWLGDLNADLILAFQTVRDHTPRLIRELTALREAHSKTSYYRARDEYNERGRDGDGVRRAALLIYLNKTGFNGLYRVNSRGEFNVPFGRYVKPSIFDPRALQATAALLRKAEIADEDFGSVLDRAQRDDFVYFDPPYDTLSRSASFTAYGSGGFGPDEQERLAEIFAKLARRKVRVMLSNHDTPLVRKLYEGFHIDAVSMQRLINSNPSLRSNVVGEVIVRSYKE